MEEDGTQQQQHRESPNRRTSGQQQQQQQGGAPYPQMGYMPHVGTPMHPQHMRHPEMMQQPMMMPQFQPYGPAAMVTYPGNMMPVPMPMPQATMMGGMPQAQMGVQPQGNVFYKTRMCNKWRSGSCPFGDKCTYAHGQHELRRVSPELLAQVQEDAHPQRHVQEDPDQKTKSQMYYKTRLCIRFMQSGYCVKGNACTFAHGYEDLRLLGQDNNKVADTHDDSDDDEQNDESRRRVNTQEQARARAMSAVAGVGQAEQVTTDADMRHATASLEDGRAFRENPYAD
ncbi:hypothetical protein M9435_005324 [Picochlorum sp. BPE23]|nr:hypothetical protein M9435_005324 [Picochlorum sp. BPE23]